MQMTLAGEILIPNLNCVYCLVFPFFRFICTDDVNEVLDYVNGLMVLLENNLIPEFADFAGRCSSVLAHVNEFLTCGQGFELKPL